MFSIGDKVLYPMHGAGIIEAIEEKKVLGETKSYYILHIGTLSLMVPVDGDSAGLRAIVEHPEIQRAMEELAAPSTEMDENWNRRNRENMEHLKTGDICEVAKVVRNLMRVDKIKKLSSGEKKLLQNAKQILASEIALVECIADCEALEMINGQV